MSNFTHLHVHTEYSLLDGKSIVKELVSRAKELGYDSLAITDHGVMYGCLAFYKECKAQGIKPIIGCEVYVSPTSMTDKSPADSSTSDDRYNHLVLLVENEQGYKNLCKICSIGFTEGFYYKPRVDVSVLEKYHEGLICLSACLAGAIPSAILKGDFDKALSIAQKYQQIFGKEKFFIELQDHGIREEKAVAPYLIQLSQKIGAELVVTNDSHYTTKDEAEAHDVLLCIQTGAKVKDEKRMRFQGEEFYLKSEEEMRQLFPAFPQAYDNTHKIADMCNFDYELGKVHLPYFEVPDEFESHEAYMRHLCTKGIYERYGENPDKKYWDQMEYELSVITQMGYTDYFLIVWDFINFAKENGIPVGPGRGSGAGSIVAYCMKITDVDPMLYELYFERFLNPERVSMPDFDIDFCYERRQEVVDYVNRKYNSHASSKLETRVSQIITYMTMAARGAVRDVGRVLDMPYSEVDKIAKLIPPQIPGEKTVTIDKALKFSPDLENLYQNNPDVHKLLDIAKSIEGMPRNASKHAAGVLICDQEIVNYAPIKMDDNALVIQNTMTELEELGLLKFDFLGLRTITVISDTEKAVRKKYDPNFDISKIPMDDAATFKMISEGKTRGVFQLEADGITDVATKMQINSIEELTAVIALYRPGPMDSIPTYIHNKFHPEDVKYLDKKLEPILGVTFGCLVYQEQVMKMFQVMAGFPLGRADIVRRAMSKKKADVMNREKEIFIHGLRDESGNLVPDKKGNYIEGALANGVSESVCNELMDMMTAFAKYAFNKAHAVCYAVVSYMTAYLICHYPTEFFAAYLTSLIGNDKFSERCNDVKKHGFQIVPPDINKSDVGFTALEGRTILFGLSAVSNVGTAITKEIVKIRETGGEFISPYDFAKRVSCTNINVKAYSSLIKAGAFDNFGYNRMELLIAMPMLVDCVKAEEKNAGNGQLSLFDLLGEEEKQKLIPEIQHMEDMSFTEKLNNEKEMTGMFFSGCILDPYKGIIAEMESESVEEVVKGVEDYGTEYSKKFVTLPVFLTDVTRKTSKKGNTVIFMNLNSEFASMKAVVFTKKTIEDFGYLMTENSCVVVKGKVEVQDDDTASIIVNSVIPFPANKEQIPDFLKSVKPYRKNNKQSYHQKQENIMAEPLPNPKGYKRGVHILVKDLHQMENELFPLLRKMPGNCPVFVYTRVGGKVCANNAGNICINVQDPESLKQLVGLAGAENVKYF